MATAKGLQGYCDDHREEKHGKYTDPPPHAASVAFTPHSLKQNALKPCLRPGLVPNQSLSAAQGLVPNQSLSEARSGLSFHARSCWFFLHIRGFQLTEQAEKGSVNS